MSGPNPLSIKADSLLPSFLKASVTDFQSTIVVETADTTEHDQRGVVIKEYPGDANQKNRTQFLAIPKELMGLSDNQFKASVLASIKSIAKDERLPDTPHESNDQAPARIGW